MNPLMSESEILALIDKALQERIAHGSSQDPDFNSFIAIRLKVGKNTWRDYSDVPSKRWLPGDTKEQLTLTLFDLALHQYYISNVKPLTHTLRVNFKRCQHGRDTNFGADTIDKLLSVMRKEN